MMSHFFHAAFIKKFLLVFAFWQFDYNMGLCEFILLGIIELLLFVHSCLSSGLGSLVIISSNNLSLTMFSYTFVRQILVCLVLSYKYLRIHSLFFIPFPFCSSNSVISIVLPLGFYLSFLFPHQIYWTSLVNFSFQLLYFSHLVVLFGPFYNFCLFVDILILFINHSLHFYQLFIRVFL